MTSEESKAWFNQYQGLNVFNANEEEQRYQAFKRRLLDEMGSEG